MSTEDLVSDTLETSEQTTLEPEQEEEPTADAEVKEATEDAAAAPEVEIDFSKPPTRVQRPDKAALDQSIEQLQKEIAALQEAQQAAQRELTALSGSSSGNRGEFDEAKAELARLNAERTRLNNERQQLIAERNASRESINKYTNESKRAEVKYSNVGAVDEEIAKLEARQQRTSMTLAEEKKVLKQIADLKQSRRVVTQIAEQKNTITQLRANKTALDQRLDEKGAELKAINERSDVARAAMNRIYEGSQSNKSKYPEIKAKIANLKVQINEKYAAIKTLRSDFKQQEKAFYAYRDLFRKYKDHERKVQDERWKAEKEAEQKALEEEELKKIPYEAEILLCDYLVNYLEGFTSSADSNADADESETKVEQLEVDGQVLRAYRRDDSDEGAAKKKKGKKSKKQVTGVKHDRIVHTVDTLGTFSALEIAAPLAVADVPACIEAVKAKKAFYQSQPRGAVPTLRELAKATAQNGESESTEEPRQNRKGKKGREFAHQTLEFPEIPGSRPGVVVGTTTSNFAAALLTNELNHGVVEEIGATEA